MFIKKITSSIFDFIAFFTSYGLGVAFTASISAFLSTGFGFYYAKAISIPLTSEIINVLIIMNIIAWTMHAIQFGLFHRIGISGFPKILRHLNKSIKIWPEPKIKENLTADEYEKLLKALIYLPFLNSITSIFWTIIIFATTFAFAIFYSGYEKSIILQSGIVFGIILFIHGGFTYILSEIATGKMRAECKKKIYQNNIYFEDQPFSSIKLKLFFLLGIFAVALYVSNTITYYNKGNIESIFSFSIFAILVSILIVYLLYLIIYNSLKEIESAAFDLKKGEKGFLCPTSLDKEFINVSNRFILTAKKINDYKHALENKIYLHTKKLEEAVSQLKEKDNTIQKELKLAEEIQKEIIPNSFQAWNGIRIAGYSQAMGKVSGDYFDTFRLKKNHLGILIADASGHGIPTALITTMAKVAFTNAGLDSYSPADVLKNVNNQLVKVVNTDDYITTFYLSITESHEVTYSNAGHQIAKLYRAKSNSLEDLDTRGLFLGSMKEASNSYTEKKVKLEAGDRIILYTDGIIKQKNPDKEKFGIEKLERLIKEFKNLDIEKFLQKIIEQVKEFSQGIAPNDDMSLLILEVDENYGKFLSIMKDIQKKLENKEKNSAANLLEEAIGLYPYNLNSVRTAGIIHYEIDEFKKSKKYFEKYLEHKTDSEVYNWLSMISIKQKKYKEAVTYSKKAINSNINYGDAYNNLAIAFYYLKDFKLAKTAIKKALDVDPSNNFYKETSERLEKLN